LKVIKSCSAEHLGTTDSYSAEDFEAIYSSSARNLKISRCVSKGNSESTDSCFAEYLDDTDPSYAEDLKTT
jgi:hypothetical protein